MILHPSATLCYYKDKADSEVALMMPTSPLKELYNLWRYIQHLILESKYDYDYLMMPTTPLKELYNLWRYIQHLILESKYDYDDEDFDNPLDEENWLLQTRGKYMKFVIYHSSNDTEPRQMANQKLVSITKGIKREETAYPTLKDDRYFHRYS